MPCYLVAVVAMPLKKCLLIIQLGVLDDERDCLEWEVVDGRRVHLQCIMSSQ